MPGTFRPVIRGRVMNSATVVNGYILIAVVIMMSSDVIGRVVVVMVD